jgi:hypothetical protein
MSGNLKLNTALGGSVALTPENTASNITVTVPAVNSTLDTLARAGNVLQVVNATHSTQVGNSSSTYADTGLTATITPSSASSKILVIVNQNGINKQTGNTGVTLRVLRGATQLQVFGSNLGVTASTAESAIGGAGVSYLDSPSTTSAVTYKTQFNSNANIAQAIVQHNSVASYITLMEIAG